MKIFIVNAFTQTRFGGNPAVIVPLVEWLPDELMQAMASQHNLSETAYTIPQENGYAIRWFTPTVEVNLCGHATLAAAHVYFNHLGHSEGRIRFHSKSGPLNVMKRMDGKITLDFPANDPVEITGLPAIEQGLKVKPLAFYQSTFDYMAVLANQREVENLSPDFNLLSQVPGRGVIATAQGEDVDFVSRCFYPQSGIDEDPVTGSAHTVMVPFWAKKFGKKKLSAIQLSKRKGWLDCEWMEERVFMSGNAVTYMEGNIF
jgi:PhzF family phenazine biosynthesis protein